MRGSPQVIAILQDAVGLEATLNEQYRLNGRSLKYLGLKKLKKIFENFADDASNWRRDLTDRIYFLEGSPVYQVRSPVEQTNVTMMFQASRDMEVEMSTTFEQDVQIAMAALDDNTRNMFEHFIKWHQDNHICWLEKQLRLINAVGEVEYISEKM